MTLSRSTLKQTKQSSQLNLQFFTFMILNIKALIFIRLLNRSKKFLLVNSCVYLFRRLLLGGGLSLSPTYHSINPNKASFIFVPFSVVSDLKRILSDSGKSNRYSTSLSSSGSGIDRRIQSNNCLIQSDTSFRRCFSMIA